MATTLKKISKMQLILLSTGGMIGSGWLFSPFYGYQTAGSGVLYSWLIIAFITLIIGLCFARVCTTLPIVGGFYRFMHLTHRHSVGTMFLILGWLSYVVYLPLEAKAVVQYLGFWLPSLLVNVSTQAELSWKGTLLAMAIIIGITWFNTLIITKVAKVNSVVSLWKIIVPLVIALIVIISFGHFSSFSAASNHAQFSFENILLAVTSSGLAFAFSGFQNGLALANQVEQPAKALPYSLFAPVLIGFILYSLLSLSYILCLDDTHSLTMTGTSAPLLALLSLFGLTWLFAFLLFDAIIAPLGTANVYTAVTARVLYGFGKELSPNGFLTKLNQHNSPALALWINGAIGILFLFPFPTWKELMNFLSSVVVFAYLAGPITILVLRKEKINLSNPFNLRHTQLIGIAGFICCTWLIYWSGTTNLVYLSMTIFLVMTAYFIVNHKRETIVGVFKENWYIAGYTLSLLAVSLLRSKNMIAFPLDNVLIAVIGLLFSWIFVNNALGEQKLEENFLRIEKEVLSY
ncbi:MAG: family permease [Gammaproteobacteria bacterium]|jgi:amino acid transporter|nr:family permease [Gammaproteobacteria bacterium]